MSKGFSGAVGFIIRYAIFVIAVIISHLLLLEEIGWHLLEIRGSQGTAWISETMLVCQIYQQLIVQSILCSIFNVICLFHIDMTRQLSIALIVFLLASILIATLDTYFAIALTLLWLFMTAYIFVLDFEHTYKLYKERDRL